MAGSILFISLICVFLFNYLVKKLLAKWNVKNWIKNLAVFFICLFLVFPLTDLFTKVVNSELAGKSGGIGLIGTGIGAGLSVILVSILYLVINLGILIYRLIRRV